MSIRFCSVRLSRWSAGIAAPTLATGCTFPPRSTKSSAVIESFTITARKPAFGGQTFGPAGSYEFISGVATVSLDPNARSNIPIVDIAAAAGPDGRTRYRTDVAIPFFASPDIRPSGSPCWT